jgi:adenylyl-sulfate kinase
MATLDAELSALRLRAATEEPNAGLGSVPAPAEPDPGAGEPVSNELPDGFDAVAYLALHPDVAASGLDPVHHYLNCGRYEGRAYSSSSGDPGQRPGFDPAAHHALLPDQPAARVPLPRRPATLRHQPVTVWLTGLSGSGKSTLASALEKALVEAGRACCVLDGDNVRLGLNRDLGFGRDDRRENIRRIAEVARLMNDAGLVVITAFISPYHADRTMARDIIGRERFLEIHVDAPLEVCERRDPKGLYRMARRGEIRDFTGISAPYEMPEAPAATVDTASRSAEQCAAALFETVMSRAPGVPTLDCLAAEADYWQFAVGTRAEGVRGQPSWSLSPGNHPGQHLPRRDDVKTERAD